MGLTTISWTATVLPDGTVRRGYTCNPWSGCCRWSEGCMNCYAEDRDHRFYRGAHWGPPSTTPRLLCGENYWRGPERWDRLAAKLGVRLKVFCASLADIFEDHPDVGPHRERTWELIARTPHLDWLLLTKRPENIARMRPAAWVRGGFPEHVW